MGLVKFSSEKIKTQTNAENKILACSAEKINILHQLFEMKTINQR